MVQRMELVPSATASCREAAADADLEEPCTSCSTEGPLVHLADRGAEAMSPNEPGSFWCDISEEIHQIDKDPELRRTPDRAPASGRIRLCDQEREAHIITSCFGSRALREGRDYLVQDAVVIDDSRQSHDRRRWGTVCIRRWRPRNGCSQGRDAAFATITIQNYFRCMTAGGMTARGD